MAALGSVGLELPFLARRRPVAATAASSSSLTTALTVLVGTGVWALFLWGGLHARWIGVSPLGSMGA